MPRASPPPQLRHLGDYERAKQARAAMHEAGTQPRPIPAAHSAPLPRPNPIPAHAALPTPSSKAPTAATSRQSSANVVKITGMSNCPAPLKNYIFAMEKWDHLLVRQWIKDHNKNPPNGKTYTVTTAGMGNLWASLNRRKKYPGVATNKHSQEANGGPSKTLGESEKRKEPTMRREPNGPQKRELTEAAARAVVTPDLAISGRPATSPRSSADTGRMDPTGLPSASPSVASSPSTVSRLTRPPRIITESGDELSPPPPSPGPSSARRLPSAALVVTATTGTTTTHKRTTAPRDEHRDDFGVSQVPARKQQMQNRGEQIKARLEALSSEYPQQSRTLYERLNKLDNADRETYGDRLEAIAVTAQLGIDSIADLEEFIATRTAYHDIRDKYNKISEQYHQTSQKHYKSRDDFLKKCG